MARDPEDIIYDIEECLDVAENSTDIDVLKDQLDAVGRLLRLLRSRVRKLAKEIEGNETHWD